MLLPIKDTFAPGDFPNLLVGLDSADDAAVWRLNKTQGLIVTTDFFTPIVDDPYDYGAIAAANSLSDVYAMGGQPVLALNIAAFPAGLPVEMMREIVRGGAEKVREAGVVVAGGHTIADEEPKFGLVVIGIVDTQHMLTKSGAVAGDHLFLTKPLGFGVTTTALKRGLISEEELREVTGWMKTLNAGAGKLASDCHLAGGTDITGYSLLGHATEMAKASGVGMEFNYAEIPFISPARKYAEVYTFPGGAFNNRLYFGTGVEFAPELKEEEQMLLFDPQTSGGLLLAVPERKRRCFTAVAEENHVPVWEIGRVTARPGIRVHRG